MRKMRFGRFGALLRKDYAGLKIGAISLFFAICYFSRFSENGLWPNPDEEDFDERFYLADINSLPIGNRCRIPVVKREADTHQWKSKLQELIGTLQDDLGQANRTAASNTILISGSPSSQSNDPFVQMIIKAAHSLGFYSEFVSQSDLSKRSLSHHPEFLAGICLSHISCPLRILMHQQWLKILQTRPEFTDSENRQLSICQHGFSRTALRCYKEEYRLEITNSNQSSLWIVTQKQGSSNFVTVPADQQRKFLAELSKSPTALIGKQIIRPVFMMLGQPVRMTAYVFTIGTHPTLLYLHRSGLFRLGNWMTFGRFQEHQTELLWSVSQLFKYMKIPNKDVRAAEFSNLVLEVVSEMFKTSSQMQSENSASKTCINCFQLLEVTLLMDVNFSPFVVTVTDFTEMDDPKIPTKVFQDLLQIILHQIQPTKNLLRTFDQFEFSIKKSCEPTDSTCLTTVELQQLLILVSLHFKADQLGFQFMTTDSRISNENGTFKDMLLQCWLDSIDNLLVPQKIVENQSTVESDRKTICEYDSMFRSLLIMVKTEKSVKLTPDFHPLTTRYDIALPFNVTAIELEFFPADCESKVFLQGELEPLKGVRMFTVGVGENLLFINVVDHNSSSAVRKTYLFRIVRQSREESSIDIDISSHHRKCFKAQSCDWKMYQNELCGLQPEISGQTQDDLCNGHGRWRIPCLNCEDESSCDWKKASWSLEECKPSLPDAEEIRKCLTNKKIAFVGDSTNRGILGYILERINGSLWENEKTHSIRKYSGLNGGSTEFSFSYYPQFWLPQMQRPSFTKAVIQGIKLLDPITQETEIVVVVGGLQFLRASHLVDLKHALEKRELRSTQVVIKTLGSGFFIPAKGVRHNDQNVLQTLLEYNTEVIAKAQQFGFKIVDTFPMTTSRYEEFRPGKCSCHFHSIIGKRNNNVEESQEPKSFTVEGPINALYAQQVLREICSS